MNKQTEEPKTFFARVVALEDWGKPDDERPQGRVDFYVEADEGDDFRAGAALDQDQFAIALDAMKARARVAFEARAKRNGKGWEFCRLTNLRRAEQTNF